MLAASEIHKEEKSKTLYELEFNGRSGFLFLFWQKKKTDFKYDMLKWFS